MLLPDVDLADPTLHASGQAHAVYRALRDAEPVSWRGTYWAITRHADIVEVASDPRRFSSARGTGSVASVGASPLRAIHLSDPPLHTELRAIFEASYGHGWIRALAGSVRQEAEARIAGWSGTVDAVASLADPLAFGVLERMLGEPLPALLPVIHRFARYDDARYRRADETPRACFEDAEHEVWRVLRTIVEARRAHPRDDVPSRMLADGRLETSDLLYALRFIVQTTYLTTALAIAAGVVAVARERDQLRALRDDGIGRAVEEILRWSTPVIRFGRHVTEDTELGAVRLERGQRVVMLFPSANRDERVFREPQRLDLTRAPNPHLAFGAGPHACLGAPLARVQLAAVLAALRDRELELVEPPRTFASSVNTGFDRVLVRIV